MPNSSSAPFVSAAGFQELLTQLRACRHCRGLLPHEPNPVAHLGADARVLMIGQAPGPTEHKLTRPWTGPSGKRLRKWLDMSEEEFYNLSNISHLPMGFCYPGKGKSGDIPPPPICSQTWHQPLLAHMPKAKLVLLIGQYAQQQYLGSLRKASLTETVCHFEEYLPRYLVMPHPSPLNLSWFKRNPWFEEEVLPVYRSLLQNALAER